MMKKTILFFDPYKCSGCMFCMTACSTSNNGATSLFRSRLQIVRHEGHLVSEDGNLIFEIAACRQCDEAPCSYICPTNSLRKDKDSGAIVWDNKICVGCQMCMITCPFGAIHYDSRQKIIEKCELCNGDPVCVKFCPTQALTFVPADEVSTTIKSAFIKKKIKISYEGEC